MTKGIAIECCCCGTVQDVTEYTAHDILGYSLDQVQHILHDFREAVPWADAIIRREGINRDTRLFMQELLVRVVKADEKDSRAVLADIKLFLTSLGISIEKEVG